MLVLKDVHVRYGAIAALRGVSLVVNQGEMVGLIGVNGAGKTTTLMTCSGVLKPTKGIISFEDQYIVGQSPEEIVRRGIALVPEGRAHQEPAGGPHHPGDGELRGHASGDAPHVRLPSSCTGEVPPSVPRASVHPQVG